MTEALLGILVASLLGSVHCAAMCGGFVCFYAGAGPVRVSTHALYNAGRLASYMLLGAVAGSFGSGIARAGALGGVTRAAPIAAGLLMVGWAVVTLAAQRGIRVPVGGVPASWRRMLGGTLERLRDRPPAARALVMGLLTTLLPCGWLYVYVAAAGATANAMDGMAVMAVFWLGTVPAMATVGLGAQRAFGPLRRRLPALSAFTVLIIGLLTLTGRLAMGGPHGH